MVVDGVEARLEQAILDHAQSADRGDRAHHGLVRRAPGWDPFGCGVQQSVADGFDRQRHSAQRQVGEAKRRFRSWSGGGQFLAAGGRKRSPGQLNHPVGQVRDQTVIDRYWRAGLDGGRQVAGDLGRFIADQLEDPRDRCAHAQLGGVDPGNAIVCRQIEVHRPPAMRAALPDRAIALRREDVVEHLPWRSGRHDGPVGVALAHQREGVVIEAAEHV